MGRTSAEGVGRGRVTRLSGRVVATTRDGAVDDPLTELLEQEGAKVVLWPTLAFEAPEDPAPLAKARADAWAGVYDWVVFTSARAVQSLGDGSLVPAGVRIAAVGRATAEALRATGWRVDVTGDSDATGLAREIAGAGPLAGARVLFPAASLAGSALEEALSASGAVVERVEAYRTVMAPPDAARVRADLDAGVDAVVFASPSAVSSLAGSLGAVWPKVLARTGVAAIGPSTERALVEAGVEAARIRTADPPGLEELVEACVESIDTINRKGTMTGSDKEVTATGPGRSEALFARARKTIPGGVNSPVRAFKGVGGTPRFVRAASGAFLEDVDGNRLLDLIGSWGVMVLGHAHPAVRRALVAAVERGTSFGTPTEGEIDLAEEIVARVPGVDVVRLVNSGTEATMSAIRLARAATGRNRIVKFRGGYHGHGDAFLVEAGSGAATLGVPSSPGVPAATAADSLVAEFNDLDTVRALFDAHDREIAAVIVEPVSGNMGCIAPAEGFLEGLRALTQERGALLIFDEVMTGFRVAEGGAQARYGVTPDLTTLGKVIGGGLPVGAYGGREDLMRMIAPDGPVYQAGTLSGNPLAVAGGLATLRYIREEAGVYDHLEHLGTLFSEGFTDMGRRLGIPLRWNGVGGMGSLFFSSDAVVDWPTAAASDRERFNRFFHGMLDRGIHLPPSPFEAWFWSYAHTEDDVARTLAAAEEILSQEESESA